VFGFGPATRIYLAVGATDMRKGFEGLYGLVRDRLQCEPLSGHVFLFCNAERNRLKLILWDGSGLWICAKKLSKGRFRWPEPQAGEVKVVVSHEELTMLLGGIDLSQTRPRPWYRSKIDSNGVGQNGASIRLPLAHRVLPRHIIRGCSKSHGALPNFWKASLFSARLSVLLPSHRSSPSGASRSGRRPRAKGATLPASTPLALLRDCDDLFFAVLCASQRFASPGFGKPLFQVIQFSGLGPERGARFGGI
jgi:transposase